jgi:hypothetical protein
MNVTQRNYAKNRINQLCQAAITQLNIKISTAGNAQYKNIPLADYPSIRELMETLFGIKDHKLLFIEPGKISEWLDGFSRADNVGSVYNHLSVANFVLPSNQKEIDEAKEFNKKIEATVKQAQDEKLKKINKIRLDADKAMDEIMLGDEHEAMAAITNFEAKLKEATTDA